MHLFARHLLLASAVLASSAWSQSPESAIKRRGFEFRPKQETPWGVKLVAPERLVWITANGSKYKIDPAIPIKPFDEPLFIEPYLKQYAEAEMALIAELLLGAPATVQVELGKPRIIPFATVLEQPPIKQYEAVFSDVIVGNKSYRGRCTFMFITHAGNVFLVHHKLREYSEREQSVEPRCDLS
jgi:hypothetical protein